MRSTVVLSILLLMFSTLCCRADKRIALVIGNSDYQSVSPLANPRNDAALIAETMRGSASRWSADALNSISTRPALDPRRAELRQ